MLHIINQFPVDPGALKKTASGDTVLFTKKAVLAIKRRYSQRPIHLSKKLLRISTLCVLKTDLKHHRNIDQGITSWRCCS